MLHSLFTDYCIFVPCVTGVGRRTVISAGRTYSYIHSHSTQYSRRVRARFLGYGVDSEHRTVYSYSMKSMLTITAGSPQGQRQRAGWLPTPLSVSVDYALSALLQTTCPSSATLLSLTLSGSHRVRTPAAARAIASRVRRRIPSQRRFRTIVTTLHTVSVQSATSRASPSPLWLYLAPPR